MNIGILHETLPQSGGAYQYSENMIKCLKKYDNSNTYVLFYTQEDFPYAQCESERWKTVFLPGTRDKQWPIRKLRQMSRLVAPFKCNLKFVAGGYHEIRKHSIDLLFCIVPSLAGYYCRIPYVVTIFDLMQKCYSEFPERAFGARLKRDFRYKLATMHARGIVADSARGKKDIVRFYRLPEGKIEIFPGIPTSSTEDIDISDDFIKKVREKFNLPDEYIFYPAQLWHHKNHIGIIKALHLLKTRHDIKLTAVFAGSRKQAYDDIMRTIEQLSMKEQIKYLGFVSDEEIQALYKKAIALVMPTFFGPANIPVWEAFALGCPVITSNVYGIDEQVGDAGLLVDPRSPEDIMEKIRTLYADIKMREQFAKKGLDRVKYPGLKNYTENLIAVFNKAVVA